MSKVGFDVGQACLNGHAVNEHVERFPQYSTKFCEQCGEATMTDCPKCKMPIRGGHKGVLGGWTPPKFCHECGAAYPWTERKAAALAEAIDELDQLSEGDREKLKQSIPDVIQDTPKTQTAAGRFGKAIGSAGQWGGKLLTEVLTKVATEAALTMSGLKP